MLMFKALWQYRGYVFTSVRNEFVTRFTRSTLGGLWAILNPLAQVTIYALIFSNVLSARMEGMESPYSFALYLCAGMLGWHLFSEVLSRSLNMFIWQGNLMKKVMFPKVVFPATVVGIALLDNLMLMIATMGAFLFLGQPPASSIVWIPFLMVVTIALGIGIGLIVGVLNVFIRDIGQAVPIVLQVAFWFTPIVYPVSIIPEGYRSLLFFNPMYPVVCSYQDILIYGKSPDLYHISIVFGVSLLLMVLGLFLFMQASEEMVDVL